MDEKFVMRFYFDLDQADRDSLKLVRKLELISEAMREIGKDTRELDKGITSLKNFAAQMNGLVPAGKAGAESIEKVSGAAQRMASSLSAGQRSAKLLNDELRKSSMLERNFSNLPEQGTDDRRVGSSFGNIEDGTRKVGLLAGSLRSVGYEALVVGGVFNRFGVAVTNALVGVVSTAIDYERAFANVARTTDDGSVSMEVLYDSLIQLSSQLPVTFQDLTEIATLGGQLGIAGSGIDEFASVVARLTATTDLTADAAGTALGRFQALLGVPASEFENLASAILKVGVNSVATETQIVNISTQISSMADFAGFTADQVVGLAGALASVGAQPELSRGTITRVFTQMSKAISEGGDSLKTFASIAGVSAEEFSSSFGTSEFAGVFQNFIGGLGDIGESGGDATRVLRDLGITSVRDVPLLLRLAGATETVNNAFRDSATGYSEQSELAGQYGKIAETTAAKIQVLVNNLTNLIAVIGGSSTGPIADFVDGLSEAVKGITALLATEFGQYLALGFIELVGIAGILATVAGAAAFAAGTFLLLSNAIATMSASGVVSAATMNSMTVAMAGAGRAAGVLATALRFVGPVALAAGAALAVFANKQEINDSIRNLRGIATGVEETFERVKTAGGGGGLGDVILAGFGAAGILGSSQKVLADIAALPAELAATISTSRGAGSLAGFGDFQKIDEEIAALAKSGNIVEAKKRFEELSDAFSDMGGDQKIFNAVFTDSVAALSNLEDGAVSAAEEVQVLADMELIAADAAERLAASIGLGSVEALKAFQDAISSGSAAFFDFGQLLEASGGSAEVFSKSLEAQIAEQQKWADNLAVLSAQGATAFVSELAKLGPAGAALAADAVKLSTEELMKLENNAALAAFLASDAFATTFTEQTPILIEAYRAGGLEAVQAMIVALRTGNAEVAAVMEEYGIVSAANPIPIYADPTEADNELTRFLNRVNSSTATVQVKGVASHFDPYKVTVPGYEPNYASGGAVYGPGTGTSDSIPARLSNGEYVIRAASVRKYGTGMFDSLNRGVARFASGGQVGGGSSGGFSTGIVELGPKSLGAVRDISRQQVYAVLAESPAAMAAYVNSGNRRRANNGVN